MQDKSDTNIPMQEQKMSSGKPKKDKGKAIQKAEDYQLQVPVQNQFMPLTFPPLPYKQAVSNPTSSSQVANLHRRQLLFLVLRKNHSVGIILLWMIYANLKSSMS